MAQPREIVEDPKGVFNNRHLGSSKTVFKIDQALPGPDPRAFILLSISLEDWLVEANKVRSDCTAFLPHLNFSRLFGEDVFRSLESNKMRKGH